MSEEEARKQIAIIANTESIPLFNAWATADAARKAADAAEKEAGAAVQEYLDRVAGPMSHAVLIKEDQKAGRNVSNPQPQRDDAAVMEWLRKPANKALAARLINVMPTTVYSINESALLAEAALNPKLAKAINDSMKPAAEPSASVVRPQKAGAELIDGALPAMVVHQEYVDAQSA